MSRKHKYWKSRARMFARMLRREAEREEERLEELEEAQEKAEEQAAALAAAKKKAEDELAAAKEAMQAEIDAAEEAAAQVSQDLSGHNHDSRYAKIDMSNVTAQMGSPALYIDVYGTGNTTSRDTARNWATAAVNVPNGTVFVVRWQQHYSWYRGNGTSWGNRAVSTVWLKATNGGFYHIGGT